MIGRIALLLASMFFLMQLHFNDFNPFVQLSAFLVFVYQVRELYYYLGKSNREIAHLLESIHYDDFSIQYSEKKNDSGLHLVYHEFNEILKKFREIRADKEAQYQYFRTIVQHIGIGIITFDEAGEVQIFNNAAKKLIGLSQIKNIGQIGEKYPKLLHSFHDLKTGGRDLQKIIRNDEETQLAVYAIELSLRNEPFKLISIQNIQSELEEKEMEAWQNLIRVLTHEIMNSVTPISSMAAIIEKDLSAFLKENTGLSKIDNEMLEDMYLALKTIHNRSKSLINFVSDFRSITRITLPNLAEVEAKEVINHVLMLLKPEIVRYNIEIQKSIKPNLKVNIDKEQIEQVVINIVKNAIQALVADKGKNKCLSISAMPDQANSIYFSFIDNGTGIEKEALKKIFIPFFTTKKNGSGIGLSLSKQIMRNHGGRITVKSKLGEGTEFLLKFVS